MLYKDCNVLQSIHRDFLNEYEISYKDFAKKCNEIWRDPYNYIVIDRPNIENTNGKARANLQRRVFLF